MAKIASNFGFSHLLSWAKVSLTCRSFTCHKCRTWHPLALLPFKRKLWYRFLSSLKIHQPQQGFNLRTFGPVASTLPLHYRDTRESADMFLEKWAAVTLNRHLQLQLDINGKSQLLKIHCWQNHNCWGITVLYFSSAKHHFIYLICVTWKDSQHNIKENLTAQLGFVWKQIKKLLPPLL